MNKFTNPFKMKTPPKKKKSLAIANPHFFCLDVSGRSFSPQNIEDISLSEKKPPNDSLLVNYDNKKFKVRTPANLIKTVQNWKTQPFQRIKHVQNGIQHPKKKQLLVLSDRGGTILPEFDYYSPSTSARTTENQFRMEQRSRIPRKVEGQRLKQIQDGQKSRQQSHQKQNIIKFQQRPNHLQSKQLSNLFGNDIMESLNDGREKQHMFRVSKGTVYAYMIRNRKKLSERRNNKKKPSTGSSLLSRISRLQQNQDNSLILKKLIKRSSIQ